MYSSAMIAITSAASAPRRSSDGPRRDSSLAKPIAPRATRQALNRTYERLKNRNTAESGTSASRRTGDAASRPASPTASSSPRSSGRYGPIMITPAGERARREEAAREAVGHPRAPAERQEREHDERQERIPDVQRLLVDGRVVQPREHPVANAISDDRIVVRRHEEHPWPGRVAHRLGDGMLERRGVGGARRARRARRAGERAARSRRRLPTAPRVTVSRSARRHSTFLRLTATAIARTTGRRRVNQATNQA